MTRRARAFRLVIAAAAVTVAAAMTAPSAAAASAIPELLVVSKPMPPCNHAADC